MNDEMDLARRNLLNEFFNLPLPDDEDEMTIAVINLFLRHVAIAPLPAATRARLRRELLSARKRSKRRRILQPHGAN